MARPSEAQLRYEEAISRIPPGFAINELGEPWPPEDGKLPKPNLLDRFFDWLGTLRKR